MLQRLGRKFGLALFIGALCGVTVAEAKDTRIFAAASLIDILEDLGARFETETGRRVTIVPGASSVLAHQIIAGAPADYFISADQTYADAVALDKDTRAYDLFGNSLVIIAPADFEGEVSRADLPELLGDGRLAVGDPTHVPVGLYAKEALVAAGVWDALADRLAPAGDVRAAVYFVARGVAPFGIVYATDAKLPGVREVGRIDADLHTPVRYWGVLTNPKSETADMFWTYIDSFEGQNRLDYAGFRSITSLDE